MSIVVIFCLSVTLFFLLKKSGSIKITCEDFSLVYPSNWEHKLRLGPGKNPWHLFFMKSKRNMRNQPTIDIYRLEKKPTTKMLSKYSSCIKLDSNYQIYDLSTVTSYVKTPFTSFFRLINDNNIWIGFKYTIYTREKQFKSFNELPEDVKEISNSIQIENPKKLRNGAKLSSENPSYEQESSSSG